MPFLDDIGPRDEQRTPVWAAFATIAGQLERLIAVNIAWALILLPAGAALAIPSLAGWLRVLLALTTATALPPATAVLFGLAAQACAAQHVDRGLAVELWRQYGSSSLRTLGPLYGTFGILIWLVILAAGTGLGPVITLLVLVLLLWCLCGMYWGPAFLASPHSPVAVVRTSVRLAWSRPERTLATFLAVLVAMAVGTASVAGVVLIVPVFIAVVQTHQYRDARIRCAQPGAGRPLPVAAESHSR